MQKRIIKLTDAKYKNILLIGVDSIISVRDTKIIDLNKNETICSVIECRHAMVTSFWVSETTEEIYNIINN